MSTQSDLDNAANVAKDAGLVAVGFTVLAIQKLQVRRREMIASASKTDGTGNPQLAAGLAAIESGVSALDAQLEMLESKIDLAVAQLDRVLPQSLGKSIVRAHHVAASARSKVRSLVLNPS